jgi:hypothetical protein
MPLSAVSVEILIRPFLSSPQIAVSIFVSASACLQFNRLPLDYQVLAGDGRRVSSSLGYKKFTGKLDEPEFLKAIS